MAFSAFELKKVHDEATRFVEAKRPPAEMRDKLDLGYRTANQSIVLFEIRPHWNKPGETLEHPVAKATYSKTALRWKVYWMRADLKWHRYDPEPLAVQLIDFLSIVDEDVYGCFWG